MFVGLDDVQNVRLQRWYRLTDNVATNQWSHKLLIIFCLLVANTSLFA